MNLSNQLLSTEQLSAVQCKGATLVHAPPGAGKTRVAIERVIHLIQNEGVDPFGILILTFGVKAARELRTRLEAVLPHDQVKLINIKTFHRFGLNLLRESGHLIGYPHDDGGRKPIVRQPNYCRNLIKQILGGKIGTEHDQNKSECLTLLNAHMTLDEIVGEISLLKTAGLSPEAAEAKAIDPHRNALAWCYGTYQAEMKQQGGVDFDDLVLQPFLLLNGDLETRAYYQSRYTHVLVDEFQDTSLMQYAVVHLLAEHHRNLTVIGDPHQSIYGFRGALGAEGFEQFRRDFPEATAVYLPHNYRSTPEVVALAQTFLTNANMANGNGRQIAVRPSGPPVFLFRASSEYQEAQWIAEEIARAQQAGYISYDDCAVIARSNAQVRLIEKYLIKSRIPCVVMGEGNFFNHHEVQVIRALMRLALDFLGDGLALREVLDGFQWIPAALREKLTGDDPELMPGHLIEGERLKAFKADECAVVRQVAERLFVINDRQGDTPEAFITYVMVGELFQFSKVLKCHPDSDLRLERVRELVRLSRQFATIGEFLDDLDTMSGEDPLSLFSAKQVSLSTVHAFKGLERKLIFFAGFEDGFFPLASATANPQEDLRLAYVGFTRARDALCVSFAQTRNGDRRLSSGWLRGLPMEMRQRPDWANEVQRYADQKLQTQ